MKKLGYIAGYYLLLILIAFEFSCKSNSKSADDKLIDTASQNFSEQFVSLKCDNGFVVRADFSKCDPKSKSGSIKLEIAHSGNSLHKVDMIKDSTLENELYLSKDKSIKFIKNGFAYRLFRNDSLLCTCINPVRVHNIDAGKGKSFVITEDFSKSDDEGYLSVDCIGFDNASAFDFGNQFPIDKIELDDLNGDGSKELYIITKSPIENENSGLCILMTIGNEITKIDFDIVTIMQNNKDYYKDFAGFDSFTLENNQVVHTFDLKKIKFSKNQKSLKGQVFYNLFKENTNWILKPVSMQIKK